MTFYSFEFFLFFPIAFIVYWLIPAGRTALRQLWLILASGVFYAIADCRFLGLLLLVTLTTWKACDVIATASRGKAKAIAGGNVVFLLVVLAVFKYLGFFADSFCAVLSAMGLAPGHFTARILIPAGLSYYIFMAVSATIDSYKGRAGRPSLRSFTAYLWLFPHILLGPIDRSRLIVPQLERPIAFSYSKVTDGLRQALYGLFKKVVIADNIGMFADGVWNSYTTQNSAVVIIGCIAYSVQIYADFSGYSDMAIGIGRMLGLDLMRNFHFPYFARNISEFWRGWHMSLTSWFTEYLYIPLGGNRRGRLRTIVNTLVVFSLCGLWHGADWSFVVWGALNGLLFIPLILRPKMKARWKDVPVKLDMQNLLHIALTFACVTLGWIFFRAASVEEALQFIGCMFTGWYQPMNTDISFTTPAKPIWALIMLAFVVVEWRQRNAEHCLEGFERRPAIVRWTVYLAMAVAVILFIDVDTDFLYAAF